MNYNFCNNIQIIYNQFLDIEEMGNDQDDNSNASVMEDNEVISVRAEKYASLLQRLSQAESRASQAEDQLNCVMKDLENIR